MFEDRNHLKSAPIGLSRHAREDGHPGLAEQTHFANLTLSLAIHKYGELDSRLRGNDVDGRKRAIMAATPGYWGQTPHDHGRNTHTKVEVRGLTPTRFPKDVGAAHELAAQDKHQFQLWALAFVEAQPFKGGRKGADGGVDGYLYFKPDGKTTEKAVVSVKGGRNVNVVQIKDLIATIERDRAQIGVFITLEEPTGPMKREAAAAGFYKSPLHGDFARIQILTIDQLFAGQKPHIPWVDPSVFKKAKREKTKRQNEMEI